MFKKTNKKNKIARIWEYVAVISLLFVLLISPINFQVYAQTADEDKIEKDIDSIQAKLEKERRKKAELEQDLNKIENTFYNTKKEINKTEALIEDTDEDISRKKSEIQSLNQKIDREKAMLRKMLQEAYYNSNQPLILVILEKDNFSEALSSYDYLLNVKEKINGLIKNIKKSKESIYSEKKELEGAKEEKEKLLAMKEAQKNELVVEKIQTSASIVEKESSIGELKAKLSNLRQQLSALLGDSYDTGDITEAAEFASKVTGVRKDFILGMLVVETDLGRYTGGCTYDEVASGAKKAYKKGILSKRSYETMKYRKDLFEDIVGELGYDPDEMLVSCNPSSYVGTGGAMGVAQFMSDTWNGYKSRISSATGHNPSDPWSLIDGVTAMAIKLGAVPGVTDHKRSKECDATKLYLSGTTSNKYQWYCDKVLYWADNYEKLL